MSNPYSPQSISNYNQSPPPSDGTQSEANRLDWDKHKTKLADPIKTLAEAIDTELTSAFGKVVGGAGVTSYGTSSTVQSSDQGKLVRASNSGITITTPDATAEGSPFVFAFVNDGGGDVTFEGNGSQTVNGETNLTVRDQEGVLCYTDGSNWFVIGFNKPETLALPKNYLTGFQLSNNATDADHDIDIAVGECRNASDDGDISLTSALTKQIDASWSAGTDAGGLSSSLTLSADTSYHVHAIVVSGSVDVGFDTSVTASNLITDHSATAYRRLGSVLTDGSSNIIAFTQDGDRFEWVTPINDVSESSPGTSANTAALSTPLGVRTRVFGAVSTQGASSRVYVSSLDATDQAASTVRSQAGRAASDSAFGGYFEVMTDTSSQVRYRTDTNGQTDILTFGYFDRRGRD